MVFAGTTIRFSAATVLSVTLLLLVSYIRALPYAFAQQSLSLLEPREKCTFVLYSDSTPLRLCTAALLSETLYSQGAPDVLVVTDASRDMIQRVAWDSRVHFRSATVPLKLTANSYYIDSLLKLEVFRDYGWARAVYMDSDLVPIRPLNDVCDMVVGESPLLPVAEWLPQPFATSMFMAFRPSQSLYARVRKHLITESPQADMDVINTALVKTSQWKSLNWTFGSCDCFLARGHPWGLPESRWIEQNLSVESVWAQARVMHFSCWGKPWSEPQPDNVLNYAPYRDLRQKYRDRVTKCLSG